MQQNSFASSSTSSSTSSLGKRTRNIIDAGGYMLHLVKKNNDKLVRFSIKTLIDKIYVSITTCIL